MALHNSYGKIQKEMNPMTLTCHSSHRLPWLSRSPQKESEVIWSRHQLLRSRPLQGTISCQCSLSQFLCCPITAPLHTHTHSHMTLTWQGLDACQLQGLVSWIKGPSPKCIIGTQCHCVYPMSMSLQSPTEHTLNDAHQISRYVADTGRKGAHKHSKWGKWWDSYITIGQRPLAPSRKFIYEHRSLQKVIFFLLHKFLFWSSIPCTLIHYCYCLARSAVSKILIISYHDLLTTQVEGILILRLGTNYWEVGVGERGLLGRLTPCSYLDTLE